MDEQSRQLLEEVAKLSRENNVAVRKLIGYQRTTFILRVVYWVIILGAAAAAYYSIQSFIGPLVGIYGGQDISKVLDIFNGISK